jgi:iron complex transport system substrate-binding protein
MKAAIPLLALVLGSCARVPANGGGPSGGIVSTNPCADAMLVELVPPSRIAAISRYSQDPGATSISLDVAQRFRSTAGTAEEVLALKPDLVVASSFMSAATRAAYARAGLKVLTFDSPTTIAASEAQVRTFAAAIGAHDAGEAMVARIEAAVAKFAAPGLRWEGGSNEAMSSARVAPATGPRPSPGNGLSGSGLPARGAPSALLFITGDLANGSGTLLDEMTRRAGFANAAAGYGLPFTGTLPVETIAVHPPRVIMSPGEGRTAVLRRRVLARLGARVLEADFPRRLMNCGGPVIVSALARLAAIRRQVGS